MCGRNAGAKVRGPLSTMPRGSYCKFIPRRTAAPPAGAQTRVAGLFFQTKPMTCCSNGPNSGNDKKMLRRGDRGLPGERDSRHLVLAWSTRADDLNSRACRHSVPARFVGQFFPRLKVTSGNILELPSLMQRGRFGRAVEESVEEQLEGTVRLTAESHFRPHQ